MKKYFYCQLLILIALLIGFMSLGYYFDYYQVFGLNNNIYTLDQRRVNPGIARHYDYELAMTGTSTVENMLVDDLDRILGKKSVNLPLSGGTVHEHSLMIAKILEFGKAKQIYYGLDIFSYAFRPDEDRVRLSPMFWSENPLQKMKSLLQIDVMANFFKKPVIESTIENSQPTWVKRFGFWADQYEYSEESTLGFDPFEMGTGLMNIDEILRFRRPVFSYDNFVAGFEQILQQVKENPEVEFVFFFPPVSMFWWHCLDMEKKAEDATRFKEYMVTELNKLPNAKTHDFQLALEITNDLNNYKDMVHFGPDVTIQMIEWLKSGKYLVTPEAQKAGNQKILELIKANQSRFSPMNAMINEAVNQNPNTWRNETR